MDNSTDRVKIFFEQVKAYKTNAEQKLADKEETIKTLQSELKQLQDELEALTAKNDLLQGQLDDYQNLAISHSASLSLEQLEPETDVQSEPLVAYKNATQIDESRLASSPSVDTPYPSSSPSPLSFGSTGDSIAREDQEETSNSTAQEDADNSMVQEDFRSIPNWANR